MPPEILSISAGCDLLTESFAVKAGEAAEFFLLVDDEEPLNLTYAATVDNSSIAQVTVDSDGVITVTGITIGQTDLPINVIDQDGLTDSIIVSILVQP